MTNFNNVDGRYFQKDILKVVKGVTNQSPTFYAIHSRHGRYFQKDILKVVKGVTNQSPTFFAIHSRHIPQITGLNRQLSVYSVQILANGHDHVRDRTCDVDD